MLVHKLWSWKYSKIIDFALKIPYIFIHKLLSWKCAKIINILLHFLRQNLIMLVILAHFPGPKRMDEILVFFLKENTYFGVFLRLKRSDEIFILFLYNFRKKKYFPWEHTTISSVRFGSESTKILYFCLENTINTNFEAKTRSQQAWLVRQKLPMVNRSPPSWRNNLATTHSKPMATVCGTGSDRRSSKCTFASPVRFKTQRLPFAVRILWMGAVRRCENDREPLR